jgi:hypothetical protein
VRETPQLGEFNRGHLTTAPAARVTL